MHLFDDPSYLSAVNWSCYDPLDESSGYKTMRGAINEYLQETKRKEGWFTVYGLVKHINGEYSICGRDIAIGGYLATQQGM